MCHTTVSYPQFSVIWCTVAKCWVFSVSAGSTAVCSFPAQMFLCVWKLGALHKPETHTKLCFLFDWLDCSHIIKILIYTTFCSNRTTGQLLNSFTFHHNMCKIWISNRWIVEHSVLMFMVHSCTMYILRVFFMCISEHDLYIAYSKKHSVLLFYFIETWKLIW